jgi:hypothetical protein
MDTTHGVVGRAISCHRLAAAFWVSGVLLVWAGNSHLRMRAEGYPQEEHSPFWMCRERLPQRRHSVCVLLRRLPNDPVPLPALPMLTGECVDRGGSREQRKTDLEAAAQGGARRYRDA